MTKDGRVKVLNAYAGVGGNRELWPNDKVKVTAVELEPYIAEIYQGRHPEDEVIVGDAHEYILKNHKNFDFVWASPPCPSHSQTNWFLNAQGVVRYPDMKLWQEILLLQSFHRGGLYVVENVKTYYEPLIKPQPIGRHYFWANFRLPIEQGLQSVKIGRMDKLKDGTRGDKRENLAGHGIELPPGTKNADKLLRNCLSPEIGLAIFNQAWQVLTTGDYTLKMF